MHEKCTAPRQKYKTLRVYLQYATVLWAAVVAAEDPLFENLNPVLAVESLPSKPAPLPLIYNADLMVGHVTLPSARSPLAGTLAVGVDSLPKTLSVNAGLFDFLEGALHIAPHRIWGSGKAVLWRKPCFAIGWEEGVYAAATQRFFHWPLEGTVGWHRKSGPFGALSLDLFDHLTFSVEYARHVNVGITAHFFDFFQLSARYLGLKELAAQAAVHINLGEAKGLFLKTRDPPYLTAPVNAEPLGARRTEKMFAHELSLALADQGLSLAQAYYFVDERHHECLSIKIFNLRYRNEAHVEERLGHLFKTLLPSNIYEVLATVVVDGCPARTFRFIKEEGIQSEAGVSFDANPFETVPLYHTARGPFTWALHPFGRGHEVGLMGECEGALFDTFYRGSVTCNTKGKVHVDRAYLQKGWGLGNGIFVRTAVGAFNAYFAGLGGEWLFVPPHTPLAIGLEGAGLTRRGHPKRLLSQYLVNFYLAIKPLGMTFETNAGRFTDHRKGVRLQLWRTYPSGLELGAWITPKVKDKGVHLSIPIDIFLKKSSQATIRYAWPSRPGPISSMGTPLYRTAS